MKKYIWLFGFLLASFYLTNQSILMMRKEDSIMKQIEESMKKYNRESINATIKENTIIPGVKGEVVDQEKSYSQMKKYGTYNETMTIMKEVIPEISIDSYYDKYIEEGNNSKRRVALVFPIQNIETMKKLLPILEKQKVVGTIFLDGNDIDKELSMIKKYQKNEYELLSFQGEYNPYYIKTAETYLENITKKETKYCYTEKEDLELLTICSKKKHHTIKPKKVLSKELTYQVKKELKNGLIISIKVQDSNVKELIPMIQYIKSKGYQFANIKELLKE